MGNSFENSSTPLRFRNSNALQALRAAAAMMVVLFHVNHAIFGTEKYFSDHPFGMLFEFGHAGVQFFFVLSGFIIYVAHKRDIGIKKKFGAFVWKRFRRVYPVYWVMLLVVIPVYFIIPSFGGGAERKPGTMLDALLLVHVFEQGSVVLTVSWTLFHELVFYAMFSILILNRQVGWLMLGAWLLICTLGSDGVEYGLGFYFSSLHVLFGMGMATAWFLERRSCAMPWSVGLLGVTCFLATGMEEVWIGALAVNTLSPLYGFASSLIVLGAVELERQGRLRVPACMVFMGDASYSIYLVHFVALSAVGKLARALTPESQLAHATTFLALVLVATAAGVAFHLTIEVPLLALMGRGSLAMRLVRGSRLAGVFARANADGLRGLTALPQGEPALRA